MFLCYNCSIDLKRQKKYSGLRRDRSSLNTSDVCNFQKFIVFSVFYLPKTIRYQLKGTQNVRGFALIVDKSLFYFKLCYATKSRTIFHLQLIFAIASYGPPFLTNLRQLLKQATFSLHLLTRKIASK